MYKKKDGMPMMGQVGMNSVFGGPRQLDVDSLQYPYSGAMTRMDQGAIDKSNQMFGPLAMRQYGMNMSGPLNKMLPPTEENPGVNKLSSSVQKNMGYTKDSSGDPLMKLPEFNTSEQVGRVNPSVMVQTADLSKAFLSGAFATEEEKITDAQNTNEQPEGIQTYKDAISATSQPIGETTRSLRQAEKLRQTQRRINFREAQRTGKQVGDQKPDSDTMYGGSMFGNIIRKPFN